jgi:hypothetical protein
VALSAMEELRSQSVMAVIGASAMIWGLAMVCGRWGVDLVPWAGAIVQACVLVIPGGLIVRRRLLVAHADRGAR